MEIRRKIIKGIKLFIISTTMFLFMTGCDMLFYDSNGMISCNAFEYCDICGSKFDKSGTDEWDHWNQCEHAVCQINPDSEYYIDANHDLCLLCAEYACHGEHGEGICVNPTPTPSQSPSLITEMNKKDEVPKAAHYHSYKLYSNEKEHWELCQCGQFRIEESHIYSNPNVCGACTVCEFVQHVCDPSVYVYNGTAHWNLCTCGEVKYEESHQLALQYDDTAHWQACKCGYIEKASHAYDDNGKCSCGHTIHVHSYSMKNNDEAHWQECACGERSAAEEHSYAGADPSECITCDDCGQIWHVFMESEYDATAHWRICVHGNKAYVGEHILDEDGECYGCAYESHVHTYTVLYDDSYHWQACACSDKKEAVPHNLNVMGTCVECFDCDYEKHTYDTPGYDNIEHWMECGCKFTSNITNHQLSYEFDGVQHWQVCSGCAYEAAHADHEYETGATTCTVCSYSNEVTQE